MLSVTHIISFINFKGGVGKTTTLIQVAETLAAVHERRVLVLDLDPQTNATVVLIGDERWQRAERDKQTLAQLFFDQLEGTEIFDLSRALIKDVSNIKMPSKGRIDLILSSLSLIEIQDRQCELINKISHVMNVMEIIKVNISTIFSDYDFVLIDCPPNLGFVTQNGIEVSDSYIIPVIPDMLSTYGLPQVIKRMEKHAKTRKLKIKNLGIVITKYDSRKPSHGDIINSLFIKLPEYFTKANAKASKMFSTVMPQANRYSDAMDFTLTPSGFKDKWGTSYSGDYVLYDYLQQLTKEILARVGEN